MHVPNVGTMPSMVVAVRILAVSSILFLPATANLAQIKVMLGHHYWAVATSQGQGDTPNPSESCVCVPE